MELCLKFRNSTVSGTQYSPGIVAIFDLCHWVLNGIMADVDTTPTIVVEEAITGCCHSIPVDQETSVLSIKHHIANEYNADIDPLCIHITRQGHILDRDKRVVDLPGFEKEAKNSIQPFLKVRFSGRAARTVIAPRPTTAPTLCDSLQSSSEAATSRPSSRLSSASSALGPRGLDRCSLSPTRPRSSRSMRQQPSLRLKEGHHAWCLSRKNNPNPNPNTIAVLRWFDLFRWQLSLTRSHLLKWSGWDPKEVRPSVL